MARDPSRTEPATEKRRQKARDEGSFPKSADFDATLLLWGNLFLFTALGSTTLALLGQQMVHFLRRARPGVVSLDDLGVLVLDCAGVLGRILLPFLALNLLVALGVQFAQRGFHVNTKPLTPRLGRLNPVAGFQRLLSLRSAVEFLKSVLKFLLFAWVAWLVVSPRIPLLLSTLRLPLPQGVHVLQETLLLVYRNVMLAMLVLAFGDFLYQRYQFEDSIKMTKQEVKDEAKEAEGSPEIKGHQRSLMMAAARRRMLVEVPKATVVITNPTHVAVALRYDDSTAAPLCVAKGLDFLAQQIKKKARESGVPLVENVALARSLYRAVKVDQPIPRELYQAVAQVLAYVYRLRGAA